MVTNYAKRGVKLRIERAKFQFVLIVFCNRAVLLFNFLIKIKMCFIVTGTLIDNGYASLLFSQTMFSYCFCMLSEFAKVFKEARNSFHFPQTSFTNSFPITVWFIVTV